MPPKYVTLPPSVSPLYPYNPPLSSAMGLSDSLCPFLQICWHSPFIEVHTRKKGLPYVRESLCKSFMDLWYKGLSNETNTFIHSFTNKYPTRHYMRIQGWINSYCPWRAYKNEEGVWGWDRYRNISGHKQADRHVSSMVQGATYAWRNQRKHPQGVAVGLSHKELAAPWGWAFQLKLAFDIFAAFIRSDKDFTIWGTAHLLGRS